MYEVIGQKNPELPVHVVKGMTEGKRKTLHRNLLLPISFLPAQEDGDRVEGDGAKQDANRRTEKMRNKEHDSLNEHSTKASVHRIMEV